jgi:uncharacterized membrane protein YdjX (TVP38/TMEM64 family)
VGVALAALVLLSRIDLKPVLQWIKTQGAWAPLVFCALYAVCTVFLIPGSLMTLGAGAVFGFGWGLLWVTIAANLGANAAFFVGRFAARSRVERRMTGHPKFAAVDKAVGREGWKIVGLLRLSPVFPFTLLNYALGVTGVTWRDYALASLIGMAPGTCLYVYLGHVVTVFITRVARRALAKQLGEGNEPRNPSGA